MHLTRTIAHIDADCFFASVELRDFPHLRGKPVLVCSRTDGRGIVLAATYEARPFGIRAGTPFFKAVKACPQAYILQSHFYKYASISQTLMEIIRTVSPDVEVCSVDEAYVDMTGLDTMYGMSFFEIALRLQNEVYEKLGITVSIGIGQSKTIAKIGSDFKKPRGITIVTSENREEFLRDLPVEKICGVGRRNQAHLNSYGIYTIGHMFEQKELVGQRLGKHGRELLTELSGTSLWKVQQSDEPQKSLSHTSTFHDFLTDRGAIYNYSLTLLKDLTRTLRTRGLEAQSLTFFLMTKDFKSRYYEHQFASFRNDDDSFIRIFRDKLFKLCFIQGPIYRKAGFHVPFVRPEGPKQYSLFDFVPDLEKKNTFSHLIDGLRERFGQRSVGIRRERY